MIHQVPYGPRKFLTSCGWSGEVSIQLHAHSLGPGLRSQREDRRPGSRIRVRVLVRTCQWPATLMSPLGFDTHSRSSFLLLGHDCLEAESAFASEMSSILRRRCDQPTLQNLNSYSSAVRSYAIFVTTHDELPYHGHAHLNPILKRCASNMTTAPFK